MVSLLTWAKQSNEFEQTQEIIDALQLEHGVAVH